MKVIIVEDELKLQKELGLLLQRNNYKVHIVEELLNVQDVVDEILNVDGDLLLLDLHLPFMNGILIAEELRKHTLLPIIMLTSQVTDIDELRGLQAGADDYVTKPFNTHILLARIEALLKRSKKQGAVVTLEHKGVVLYLLEGTVHFKGQKIEVTKNELGILKELMRQPGVIVPRIDLIRALWEMEFFVEDSTLTVNINRLRKKLEQIGIEDFIRTKHGMGYQV